MRLCARGQLLSLIFALSISVHSAQAQVAPPPCDGNAVHAELLEAERNKAGRDLEAALLHMRRAYELCGDLRHLYNQARLLDEMKRYPEAVIRYREFLDLSIAPQDRELRVKAAKYLSIAQRMSRQTVLQRPRKQQPKKPDTSQQPKQPDTPKQEMPDAPQQPKQPDAPKQEMPDAPQQPKQPDAPKQETPDAPQQPQKTDAMQPGVGLTSVVSATRSVYRRPWFWATMALGVAVSGVVVGVVLGTRPARGPDLHPFDP